MKRLPFVFGIHNHQPLGNFDPVIERLTSECYLPFLSALKKAPWMRFNCHISGPLLEWWERHSSQCIDLIGECASRGNVELLAGGYFEPVLAAIPGYERQEQIQMLKTKIKSLFGQEPRGIWLTERVWEAEIIGDLVKSGIEYCLVDDRHFRVSGFKKEELYGYYVTESGGEVLKIFPIDQELRYHIPFSPIGRLEAYLDSIRKRGGMAIYVDDGEKFGAWPGTKKWVYEDGWLEVFLARMRDLSETYLEMVLLGEAVDTYPPKGLVYLPNASYEEMEEWTLRPDVCLEFKALLGVLGKEGKARFEPFLRGGHWKNFFVKYPESNYLHKRNLELSLKTRALPKDVRRFVLASQCNDAYWHGIFGGLYLPHLRAAVWDALLKGDGFLASHEGFSMEERDLDLDGNNEAIIRSDAFCATFSTIGGQMIEYSIFSKHHNYSNCLTRRFEYYHQELREQVLGKGASNDTQEDLADGVSSIHNIKKAPSEDILDELHYDWYEKRSFVDHFFDPQKGVYDFKRCDFSEWGDFANQPFEMWLYPEKKELVFRRVGGIYEPGRAKRELTVEKHFTFMRDGTMEVEYVVVNGSNERISCAFGVEWNLYPEFLKKGLSTGGAVEAGMFVGDKKVAHGDNWEMAGEELNLVEPQGDVFRLRLEEAWHFLGFPVKTVSQSESGYDRTIQGLSIMAKRPIDLGPHERFSTRMTLSLQPR